MIVRRLRAEETEPFRDLRLRALRLEPAAFCSTYERESAFSDEVWRERAAQQAESPERACFVLEQEDRLVGMGGVMLQDGAAEIWGIYLDAEARGRGAGRMLLQALLDWIGPQRAHLEVNERLDAAQGLYRALGFRPDGRRHEEGCGRFMVGWTRPAVR